MKTYFLSRWGLALVIGISLFGAGLTGCGGGGSGEKASASAQVSGFNSIIEGQVIKGPIASAMVQAFRIDESGIISEQSIAQTLTDAEGNYRLELGAFQGALQIVASTRVGTTMRDEATGRTLTPPVNFRLRAVALIEPPIGKANASQDMRQTQIITVSPFSELVTVVASALGEGRFQRSHILGSIAAVKDAIGFDPIATRAVDATRASAAYVTPDSRMYGLALAAVSWLASYGDVNDDQMRTCLRTAEGDSAKRIACAGQLISNLLEVDATRESVGPKRVALAFTDAVRQAEQNPELNKTGMTLSLAPAMLRLEGDATAGTSKAVPLNNNSGGMSGLTAAKKLLESLRSNADAINIGMTEEGTTAALSNLGRSLDQAGNMAMDVGTLIDMINGAVVHWNEYRVGRRSSASFNNLPVPNYWNTDYYSCSIYSSFLPENLLEASPLGGAKGVPYIVLSPLSASLKTSTSERVNDSRLLVDSTLIVSTQPSEARWIGCTRFSKQVTSLVDSPGVQGLETNTTTRYQQSLRLRIDTQDANGRPTRLSYVANTVKQYIQRYSSSDASTFLRRINLLDAPLQGVIDIAWSANNVASARIVGDLPPSVDDSTIRSSSGFAVSSDLVRASRYATDAQALLTYVDTSTRIDIPKISLGFVPLGTSAIKVTLETDPGAPINYVIAPKTATCVNIAETRLNIAATVSAPDGKLTGRVAIIAPPDCGTSTEATNGSIRFSGALATRNKLGQPVDVIDASLQVSSANRVPTVWLQGKVLLPAREPMNLSLSVSATEATVSAPGTSSVLLGYTQGNFSMNFNGLQQEDFLGSRSSAFFSMSGTGGISAAWVEGDRNIALRENGKLIGEIDTRSGRVLFNDGSFQFIR